MKELIFLFMISLLSSSAQEPGAKYLIVTHDNFYGAIQPLAEWKHKKGMRTKVVKLSEIGSDSVSIRNYILNAYNNWQLKPEFLLLVGAPSYLPFPMVTTIFSDNYYTNMDGDVYNEMLSGRLTVHNTNEAQTVVNKILAYERTPWLADSLWFKKACLIANDYPKGEPDDDSLTYRLDVEYAASYMVNSGFVKIDTFFATHGDNATSVINATNAGRGYVLYRGRATNNWYDPFAVYPDNLANGNMLPIVISATCNTLGTGATPATAERWFLTGSPAALRGASGYFATSTHGLDIAYLRSALTRGFFDGVFLYDQRTFGEVCERGRLKVYADYPYSGGLEEYYGFTTVGDPEMNLWTAAPMPISVVHDTVAFAGIEETLRVSVFGEGVPVESASVCVLFDTVLYDVALTNASGAADFVANFPGEGIISVTVTGRNLCPYEGSIHVISGSTSIGYVSNSIDDSLGNSNGMVDAGETVLLWATLRNFGTGKAVDVLAYLRSGDTAVFISESISTYGDIAPGAQATGLNPFVFSVSPFTVAHPIEFEIIMTDSTGSVWNGSFSIVTTGYDSSGTVTGPDQYGYYVYDDTDTLIGNAPSFAWLEIAPPAGGPGLIISEITNDDADTVTLPLPFSFKFYGASYSTVGVCSNGFVEIGGANYPFSYNDPIPTLGRARSYAAPFWDDLDPSYEQYGHGDIYRYYDAVNHRWIVEFYQVALGYDPYTWQTFQVILRDPNYYATPTGDGEILFQYQNISNATSSTVGIEDVTEMIGIQYVYNNNYDQNAAVLGNGRAILVTTKPPVPQRSPWLQLMSVVVRDSAGGNNNGLPEPHEVIEVVLAVKNAGDTSAASVWGQLSSGSISAVVLDDNADYGDLAVGGSASNAADPYEIQVGAEPVDTVVGMAVRFVGNVGNYESYGYFTLRIYHEETVAENALDRGPGIRLSVCPNPFVRSTQIQYALRTKQYAAKNSMGQRAEGRVLEIYDAAGRQVKSFALGPMPFAQSIVWNGDDDCGRILPAGVYFVKLEHGDLKAIDKVIIIK